MKILLAILDIILVFCLLFFAKYSESIVIKIIAISTIAIALLIFFIGTFIYLKK